MILLLLLLSVPRPAVTPGLTRPLGLDVICSTRWGTDRRHVTTEMKKEVAEAYGVPWSKHGDYEFDHLIPRSLGGADDVKNLWPQPWASAYKKDALEVRLGKLVCAGQLDLATAQAAIANDWEEADRRWPRKAQ